MPTLEEVDARLQTIEAKAVVYSEALRTIFRVLGMDHLDRRAWWRESGVKCSGLVTGFDVDTLRVTVTRDDTQQEEAVDVFTLEGFI